MSAPEVMTYATLHADIASYCERDDAAFTNQIDRFIALAEIRLATEAKGLGLQRVVTDNLVLHDPVFNKPERWRQTKSIFYTDSNGEVIYLFMRKYEYCRVYSPVTVFDTPKYYSDYDFDHFFITPTPDVAYPFELSYYERPEPLSASNQVNWTTRYAPQLLLYACLLEAQPFLKNPTQAGTWQQMYGQALQALQNEDAGRLHTSGEAAK